MNHETRYHMRDQMRDRVRTIMCANGRRPRLGSVLWPLMAIMIAALVVVNIMVVAPPA